jgi:hypothetical protein
LPWPFKAFDAVPVETPARAATSRIVARLADSGSGLSAGTLTGSAEDGALGGLELAGKGLLLGACPAWLTETCNQVGTMQALT